MPLLSKRLLLVSPNLQEGKRIVGRLRAKGIEVITCVEKEAAQVLLAQVPLDVLLVDVQSLGHGAYNALWLIRYAANYFPSIRIVGFMKERDEKVEDLTRLAGANYLLAGSLQISRLWPFIKDVLPAFKSAKKTKQAAVYHLEDLEIFLADHAIKARFQPIVAVSSLQAFGLESLARFDKRFSLWNPEILFAYAAQKGFTFETDISCIEAALTHVNSSQINKLFVNVRPRSVVHSRFVSEIKNLLNKASFPFSKLVLELTEQESILNFPALLDAIEKLRQEGCEIALDDFGVGFSNLHLMQSLKPSYIKLSGVFCRNLPQDASKQIIVKSMAKMTSQLGISTILENVENEEELKMARQFGIQYVQGYYFCKPLSASRLMKQGWLKKDAR